MKGADQGRWRALYGWLVRLLPRDFRERNEFELLAVFDERLEHRSASALLRECLDVLGLSVTLRLGSQPRSKALAGAILRAAPMSLVDSMGSVRQSIRGLIRAPAFSLSVLATMGFGLGTVSVVFTLAWGLWLSPLPYRDPGELVTVADVYQESGGNISVPELADYEMAPALAGLAAYRYGALITNDAGTAPERVTAYAVEPHLFSLLGVAPALGRTFIADDVRNAAIIISNRFWRSRYGGDQGVIGRTLATSAGTFTIVGVMPRAFEFPYWLASDVWRPFDREENPDRADRIYSAIGRLRPGATRAGAAKELHLISERLALVHPETNRGWRATVGSLVDETVGHYRHAVSLLLGLVALLACVSVTNSTGLFLARRLARQNEIAVRLALGASAWRLRCRVLVESVVLAAGAATLGVVVAVLTAGALAATLPADTPRLAEIRVTWHSVAVVSGIALAMALVGGTLSSLGITRPAGLSVLHGSGLRVAGGARHRLRSTLVVGEIALSVILLVGAGITIYTFTKIMRVDRGFDAKHLVTTHVTVPFAANRDPAVRVDRMAAIQRHVSGLPGATAAAMSTGYPGSRLGVLGGGTFSATDAPDRQVSATMIAASPGYFAMMRTPVRTGREFSTEDRLGSAPVAVLNETAAKALWPGGEAVGNRIRLPQGTAAGSSTESAVVVGVVADMRLSGRASPIVYVAVAQGAPFWVDVMVRTAADPSSMIASVERALREIEPDMLVEQSTTMEAFLADIFALERAQMTLAALFGTLASLLTAIGVYGLLATIVAQRTQEIGIRRALGAPATAIAKTVMLRGVLLGVSGVALGTGVLFAVRNLMVSYLPDLTVGSVVVGISGLVVLAVVTAACAAAALRALRIDPVRVLR